jgi:hypothetical protein
MLGSEALVGALWLIAALGAAVFAAVPAGRAGLGWIAGGFTAGAVLVRAGRLPEPGELATGVALLAMFQILRPGRTALAAAAAGLLAGVWSRVLVLQGLPEAAALPLAACLPGLVQWVAARRPAFATRAARDEALAAVFVGAILAALLPGMLDGWRSAQALNIEEPALDVLAVPAWAAAVGLGALASGGAWAAWSRR